MKLANGTCTPNEKDCYAEPACLLSNNTSGTDNTATATCNFSDIEGNPVWFNANYSLNWRLHLNPADGTTGSPRAVTGQTDSAAISTNQLAAIDIATESINYGSLTIGGVSSGQNVSMGNAGNQVIDVLVKGTDMTSGANTIPAGQQYFHESTQDFTWGSGNGGFALQSVNPLTGCTPTVDCAEAQGCLNRDLLVRTVHNNTSLNEDLWWKVKIPAIQTIGTYAGANTFSSAAPDTCTGTGY